MKILPNDYWGSYEDTYDRLRAAMDLGPNSPTGLPTCMRLQTQYYDGAVVDFIRPDYFLNAARLERWQDIPAAHKTKAGKVLSISHIWHSRDHPDPHNIQLLFLRLLSIQNPDCVFFYDYCSLPQEPRTPIEHRIYTVALSEIRPIFMGTKVVALATHDDYFDRAWCLLELFCHLLSPLERPIAIVSFDNPAFAAHMLTIIEGEKYREENLINMKGWKERTMRRVATAKVSIDSDREVVLGIMDDVNFTEASLIKNSEKGCVEFLSPRGNQYIVAN